MLLVVPLLVCGVIVVDRLARRRDFVVAGAMVAQGWIPAVSGIVGAFVVAEQLTTGEVWIGRASTAVLAVTVGVALLRPRPMQAGRLLMLAALLHYSITLLTSVIVGTASLEYLQDAGLMLLAFVAIWAAPRVDIWTVVAFAKIALAITVVGSLIVIVANAPEAWLISEGGLVPGTPGRLQGATYHPNVLGPLPLLYLILERYWPSHRWVRWPLSVLAVAALVLSESKTAWVAAVVVGIVLWSSDPGRSRNARFAASLAVIGLIAGLAVYALEGVDELAASTVSSVTTLTGRTELWQIGLDAWQRDPLVGAGPEFFMTYAANSGQTWAGQAHNQFVQTLTQHGIVGLVTLGVYVGVLVQVALRNSVRSRATSVALVALLLVRGITETPLSSLGIEHLTVFTLLMAWERERHRDAVAAAVESRRRVVGDTTAPGRVSVTASRTSVP